MHRSLILWRSRCDCSVARSHRASIRLSSPCCVGEGGFIPITYLKTYIIPITCFKVSTSSKVRTATCHQFLQLNGHRAPDIRPAAARTPTCRQTSVCHSPVTLPACHALHCFRNEAFICAQINALAKRVPLCWTKHPCSPHKAFQFGMKRVALLPWWPAYLLVTRTLAFLPVELRSSRRSWHWDVSHRRHGVHIGPVSLLT